MSLIDSNSSIETHFLMGLGVGGKLGWKSEGREKVGVEGTETEYLVAEPLGVRGDSGTIMPSWPLGDGCGEPLGDEWGDSPLGDLGDPAILLLELINGHRCVCFKNRLLTYPI